MTDNTTNQTKTKPEATETPEPPRVFHIYRTKSPDTTLCGSRYSEHGGRAAISDAATSIPRSGYEVCPLCALALQMRYGLSDHAVERVIAALEADQLAKRYSI